MVRFKVKDSKISVSGEDTKAIVKSLNEQSLFGYNADLKQYMIETAEAVKIQIDKEIRPDTYDEFVLGLINAGLLIEDNTEDVI